MGFFLHLNPTLGFSLIFILKKKIGEDLPVLVGSVMVSQFVCCLCLSPNTPRPPCTALQSRLESIEKEITKNALTFCRTEGTLKTF